MGDTGFLRAQHRNLLLVDDTLNGLLDQMAAYRPTTTIGQIGAKDL
jgi:hypothetical protein